MALWRIFLRSPNAISILYLTTIGLCAIVIFMRMVAHRLKLRHPFKAHAHARCAKCHYILVRGHSTTCPECGADVRVTGLFTRPTWPAMPRGPASLLLALLMIPLALRLAKWTMPACPFGWSFHAARHVYVPEPGGRARYAVQIDGRGRYFERVPEYFFVYRNDGADYDVSNSLVYYPSADEVMWNSKKGVIEPRQPLIKALLARFVAAATPRAERAECLHGADNLLAAIDAMRRNDFPRSHFWTPDLYVNYSLSDPMKWTVVIVCYLASLAVAFLIARRVAKILLRCRQRGWLADAARVGLVPPTSRADSVSEIASMPH